MLVPSDALRRRLATTVASLISITGCGPQAPASPDGTGTETTTTTTTTSSSEDGADAGTLVEPDMPTVDTGLPSCVYDSSCDLIDILFVIDNSGSMSEEQLNVSRNLSPLFNELLDLRTPEGDFANPNFNFMVTTTDVGHPLCDPLAKPDYEPQRGAPVTQGCNARIERFTGLDPMDPPVIEEACTEVCPIDVVPDDHFIHLEVNGSNVPGNTLDAVEAAFSCLGPQGFDGCDYPSPLEAMLLALDPEACWNDPTQPQCAEDEQWAGATEGFLREDAALVVVFVTDGMDCSVAPGGYSSFTDPEDSSYWSVDPALGIPRASPAICFNAGVSCDDGDGDGTYEDCTTRDDEVLHPIERYTAALAQIREEQAKDVMMLGILGVPEVTLHDPNPPFPPSEGGVFELVFRDWVDGPYPRGDTLPDAWDEGRRAEDEAFEHGALAPGCIGTDSEGAFIGQALPPVRIREVCESLDLVDDETGELHPRCCIESLCDPDFSAAVRCLTGILSSNFTTGEGG